VELQKFIDSESLIVINYVGHPLKSHSVREVNKILDTLKHLMNNNSPEIKTLFDEVRQMLGLSREADVLKEIENALKALVRKENICRMPKEEIVNSFEGSLEWTQFFEDPNDDVLIFKEGMGDLLKNAVFSGDKATKDNKKKTISRAFDNTVS
jgi:spore cortex formation protein SpoVR/YcgB (stage V sporulation)